MLFIIIVVTAGLIQASVSHISGSGNTEAQFSHDAHYWCSLTDTTGVLQVTWQRLYGEEPVENLASYSEHFGLQVNAPYVGKVELVKASLSSTAIVVKNVTWDDDGCYICSFNIYPEGSQRKHMCLTVKGLSEVETNVHVSGAEQEDGDDKVEVVFSCSATGKPAPTVDWESPDDAVSQQPSTTTTVSNGDHTFTSSSSFTVQVARGHTGHVECVLNRGTKWERRETIPFPMHDGKNTTEKHKEEDKKDGEPRPHAVTAIIVCVVVFLTCAAMFAAFWMKRLKDKGTRGPV